MPADPPAGASDSQPAHPLAQAFIDAHTAIAPKIAAANTAHVVNLLETFEADIGPLVAPIAQQLLDDPGTHEMLRPLLNVLARPEHFGESVLIGIALGSILSPVLAAAFAPIVQDIASKAWDTRQTLPLSPDLLAAASLKGVAIAGGNAAEAALSGVDGTRFGVMVETAGQSIGIEEALLLFRRGQIDAAHLQAIMQYSNLNPKFYADVPLLQYGPVPAAEAVTGALKGHLDDATAQTYLAHAGIDPSNYAWLKATAGRPPGLEQMLHLWNRGVATQTDVENAVRQSDINDVYLPFVTELRKYFPPPRSIVPMLRAGAITEAQARTLLSYYGVDTEWADAFIKEATTTKASTGKQLSQSQVLKMFEAEYITQAEATTRLQALGLPADEITLLVGYTADVKVEKLRDQVIAQVRTLYTHHKMGKPDATGALSSAGVPNATALTLFRSWDIERAALVHSLTPAGIVGAYRRGYITAADCKTRLTQVGVQPGDIGVVVADGWPPTKGAAAIAAANAVVAA